MSETRTFCLETPRQVVVTRFQRAGRGETVVLVHGVGAQACVWKTADRRSGGAFLTSLYMTCWAHGGSSPPRSGAQLSDYSDQLLALVDFLGISRCPGVGHSMGALVALEFRPIPRGTCSQCHRDECGLLPDGGTASCG